MTAGTLTTRFLELDGGRIAYDDTAFENTSFDGAALDPAASDRPLVVCTPGLGDTRASYRHLRPLLTAATGTLPRPAGSATPRSTGSPPACGTAASRRSTPPAPNSGWPR